VSFAPRDRRIDVAGSGRDVHTVNKNLSELAIAFFAGRWLRQAELSE
jgi:hypothetical protein